MESEREGWQSPEGVVPLFCRNRSVSVGVDKTKGIPTRRPVILQKDVDDYIEFYNHRRFHETLAYKKPMKVYSGSRYFCESLFWASQPTQAAKT
jgi:hypothetical protein